MNSHSLLKYLRSLTFLRIALIIGLLVIAGIIFEAGVFVGFHKAAFALRSEENYRRNFGAPFGGSAFFDQRVPNPHGAAGKIVDISLPTFTIAGNLEEEKTVRIATSTIIRDQNGSIAPSQLSAGEMVVVIGTANDHGEVDATLIRVLSQ